VYLFLEGKYIYLKKIIIIYTIYIKKKMIFVQSFFNNFLSYTRNIFLISLFLFLFLLFLTNQRRETQSCHKSCTNITTHKENSTTCQNKKKVTFENILGWFFCYFNYTFNFFIIMIYCWCY